MASSEQLRFVPDTLPVVAQEKSPAANDEQPVAGEAVHARGEISPEEPKEPITVVKKKVEEVVTGADESVDSEVTARAIRKGDVFTNPQTGEREVVEGVRKKKENGKTVWTVLFTKELKPGVRAEPGEPMRQMDFRNFEVQRQAGGYAEWTPVYEREYDDIFHDCQQVFEALAEVLEEGEQSGQELSVEALDQADAVGKLSIEAGALDDAWVAMETERNPKTAAKKLELLDQLKQIVAKLPEPWVEPHPRLKKVQEEWKRLHESREKEIEDEGGSDRGVKKRVVRPRQREEDTKRRPQSDDGRNESRYRNKPTESVRDGVEANGELDARMEKYFQSKKWWEQNGWNKESVRPLQDWIDAIRWAQTDLTDVAREIERLGGTGRWEEVMQERSGSYQDFAREVNGDEIDDRIRRIDPALLTVLEPAGEQAQLIGDKRTELYGYLTKYLGVLRAAAMVLAELRQGKTRSHARGTMRLQKRGERGSQSGRNNHGRRGAETPSGNASPKEDSPEQHVRDEINEDAEKDFYTAVADVKLLHEALYRMRELIHERRVKGKWEAALDSGQRKIIAESGFRGILGEVDDIEDTFTKNNRGNKWENEADRVDWLFAKTERMEALSKAIKDVLRIGEKVLESSHEEGGAHGRRGKRRSRSERAVEVLTPEGRALQIVDSQYALVPQAREVLVLGMREIADKTREIITRLREAMTAQGISQEDQIEIIKAKFLPKVIEGTQLLLSQAGVNVPESEAKQVAQQLLLPDTTPKLTYDRPEA